MPSRPMIALPVSSILVIYRQEDGCLLERNGKRSQGFGSARSIPGATAVSGAVDSDQVGADTIEAEGTVHFLYRNEAIR